MFENAWTPPGFVEGGGGGDPDGQDEAKGVDADVAFAAWISLPASLPYPDAATFAECLDAPGT